MCSGFLAFTNGSGSQQPGMPKRDLYARLFAGELPAPGPVLTDLERLALDGPGWLDLPLANSSLLFGAGADVSPSR